MGARGFILQASYRVQAGVPVVYLFGKLEDGSTFLIRDRRQVPRFYIRAADEEAARALGAVRIAHSQRRTFAAEPTCRVELPTPGDTPALRDRLHASGIDTFEADVRFAVRYLIDRGVRGGCEIEGHARAGSGTRILFEDPELTPAPVPLTPAVLSFDIETDPKAKQLLAISLYGCGADEVLICDPDRREMPPQARAFADEHALLDAFCARIGELDPDVLTGWNVIDFDLSVLERIARRVHHPLELGRDPGRLRIRAARGYFGSGSASIPGRLVLDGIDLLRGAFVRMDDYSLDAVAQEVLGEGKVLEGDARGRAREIMHNYAEDLETFALYARTDARLALEIVEKMKLIELAFARSALTGMTPDRVAASIASFDFLYLSALHKRGIVAPTVRSSDSRVSVAQAGGEVFEPRTGVHDGVWVFDFKSLYPSIIRTFNIDPLGFVAAPTPGDEALIVIDEQAAFRRGPAILPQMLDGLFPQRELAKEAGDPVASQAIKILMNSFYGVLGTPACRFHNPAIANAITGLGRHLLQWTRRWFEQQGYPVLYGDTDSLFVSSPGGADVHAKGERLAAAVTRAVGGYVGSRWRVESRLELEFEKLYQRLFLPSVRHGEAGARKRYVGQQQGADEVEFVGMEVVRRDWTELAKQVQRELYARLFADQAVDAYLADVVARVRAGELDDELIYHKGLRKRLSEYTASTPPHVAAARKSPNPPGRIVSYVITTDGPEPLDARVHPLDREHYVDKQIKPVAEPVLATLGLSFEQVIGDDRQMGLF